MPYFPNYRLGPITSIEQDLKINKSVVYPNPVKDKLFILNNNKENLHYEIIDIIGQNVLNGIVNNFIDVENLKNGFYFLKLKSTTE